MSPTNATFWQRFSWRRRPADREGPPRPINPPKVVFFSFLVAILVGTALLLMPFATAHAARPLRFIDALFTATSGTCVTGLIVKDTGGDFSLYGRIVILALVQIGGLGIMTLSTFFLLLFSGRVSVRDTLALRSALGKGQIVGIRSLLKHVLLYTFAFELFGAIVLFFRFRHMAPTDGNDLAAAGYAIFHSISGFCNAGFSLYADSMARYRADPVVMLTMSGLVICGGLGFAVLYNLGCYRRWRRDRIERGRLTLQTKAVLACSGALLLIGFVFFLCFEWNNAMRGMGLGEKVMNAFFCAVTPRTAGFSTINYGAMSRNGLFLTTGLMFIGASPGSTGGGIKTTTLLVLLATARASLRGVSSPVLFRRAVPNRPVQKAIAVVAASLLVVLVATLVLTVTERHQPFDEPGGDLLSRVGFEATSAFGTVGLSTGITPALSTAGRAIVIMTMFVGRIGPLVLALMIAGRETPPMLAYPEEDVMIG